ncbi:hypothetical protein CCR75_008266 [Bremia lactucae]|uniref:Uncharacterized protein n=1 Tax=Bremia lactucae TaxID=4779 RepID=A0A976IL80_BRELC|nr:hypothetical protein CCR75_008266 [Bremia lactucae]
MHGGLQPGYGGLLVTGAFEDGSPLHDACRVMSFTGCGGLRAAVCGESILNRIPWSWFKVELKVRSSLK